MVSNNNNNNNNKSNKVKIFVILLVLLIVLCGGFFIYRYFFYSTDFNIEVDDSKLYPNFDKSITEYVVYTDKDQIKINCSKSIKSSGCNKTVDVNSNETNYTVKNNGQSYDIVIHKMNNSNSNISIKDIKGIPTNWVKFAKIEVEIDNPTEVKEVQYSFDGGKEWKASNVFIANSNTELNIVVKDYFGYESEPKKVKIGYVDNIAPTVNIEKSEENGVVTLNAVSVDNESGIKSYLWNTGETTSSIIASSKTTYSVEVSDNMENKTTKSISLDPKENNSSNNEDNKSDTSSSNENSSNTNTNTNTNTNINSTTTITGPSVKFDGNGASTNEVKSCQNTNTCVIKTPSISRDGYEIIGWSTNKDTTKADVNVNSEITINKDITYYAITRKIVTASFDIQNKNAANIEKKSDSCYLYNQSRECYIKIPNVTEKSGYRVIGWNTDKNSQTSSINSGDNVSISSNVQYYLISLDKNPIEITFDKGAASSISKTSVKCYKYNGSNSCYIKSPSITPKSTDIGMGWNDALNSTFSWEQNTLKSFSSNKKYYAITRSKDGYDVEFIVQDRNATTLSNSTLTCYKYNFDTSCSIKTPVISLKSGYESIGWSDTANSTKATYAGGKVINLNSSKKLYTVTKFSSPVTVVFNSNGSNNSKITKSCYKYNGASSCSVKSPTISPKDKFNVLGWNTAASATSSSWNVDIDKSFTTSKTYNYYAITKNNTPLTASFNVQDTSAVSVDKTNVSCYKYNGAGSCNITIPNMVAKSSNYQMIGWNTNKNATTSTATPLVSKSISQNTTFYTITKNTTGVYANFSLGDSNFTMTFDDYSGSSHTVSGNVAKITCYKYNGSSNCKIRTPKLDKKTNSSIYKSYGWNTKKTNTASIQANQLLDISSNTSYVSITSKMITVTFHKNSKLMLYNPKTQLQASTMTASCESFNNDGCKINESDVPLIIGNAAYPKGYSLYSTATNDGATYNNILYTRLYNTNTDFYAVSGFTYNIDKNGVTHSMRRSAIKGNVEIEYDTTLDVSVVNSYLRVIDDLYSRWPEMFNVHGKVVLLESNLYKYVYNDTSGGVCFGGRFILIPVTSSFSDYTAGSIVHELGHAFDGFYSIVTGTEFNTKVKTLFDKYSAYSTRPMREYSYSNISEFIADTFRFTYANSYNLNLYSSSCESGYTCSTNTEISNFVKKYRCIAKNRYKEVSSCG